MHGVGVDSHWHIYSLNEKKKSEKNIQNKHPKYRVHRQEDIFMYKYNTARQE